MIALYDGTTIEVAVISSIDVVQVMKSHAGSPFFAFLSRMN